MNLVNREDVLPREFYSKDTRDVARLLLGKRLVRQTNDGVISGEIVETEAYLTGDEASHSFKGRTPRNLPMFGLSGRTYVYLSYGIHDMLNIVSGGDGVGEAVLIRAVMPISGIELMRIYTNKPTSAIHRLASGPGLVAKAFGISRHSQNQVDLTSKESGLWIEQFRDVPDSEIVVTTRIGITKSAERPLRYYIAGSSAVSRL